MFKMRFIILNIMKFYDISSFLDTFSRISFFHIKKIFFFICFSKKDIINHAYDYHPESIEHLMNVNDKKN